MPLTVWTQGCMTRIFPHQAIPTRGPQPVLLHAARGEVEAFQIGVPAELNDLYAISLDLVSPSGAVIPAEAVEVLYPEHVPVHLTPSESTQSVAKSAEARNRCVRLAGQLAFPPRVR